MRTNKVIALLLFILFIVPIVAASEPIKISQGATVYINHTVDISSVGSMTDAFEYYGPWWKSPYNGDPVLYTLTLPTYASSYYHFNITPEIFGNRTGPWYQKSYFGNETKHANLLAFTVNGTDYAFIENRSFTSILEERRPVFISVDTIKNLTARPVSDIYAARGSPITYTANGSYLTYWLIGEKPAKDTNTFDILIPDGSTVNIDRNVTAAIEPGIYYLVLINPGKNEILEENWNDAAKAIETRFRGKVVQNTSCISDTPFQVQGKLLNQISLGDDTYSTVNVVIDAPGVDVQNVFEIDNTTVLINGYTSLSPGEQIRIVFDEDNQTARTIDRNTYYAKATGDIGEKRIFEAFMTIDKYNLPVGPHTITLYAGKSRTVITPYIIRSPEGQQAPPFQQKYIGNNPFIPTPPPIIEEKIVVQERIEYRVQKEIVKEPVNYVTLAGELLKQFVPIAIEIMVIGVLVIWSVSVIIRASVRYWRTKPKKGVEKPSTTPP